MSDAHGLVSRRQFCAGACQLASCATLATFVSGCSGNAAAPSSPTSPSGLATALPRLSGQFTLGSPVRRRGRAARRGLSFFGEGPQGPTGWAGIGGIDFYDPNADNDNDQRRRLVFGGAHWSQAGRGRLGVVITLEQEYSSASSQLLGRRLLAQTHVEF